MNLRAQMEIPENLMIAPTGGLRIVAILIDEWKLNIFERHLKQAGYAFETVGHLTESILVLRVGTTNPIALGELVMAANTEAVRTGSDH